MVNTISYSASTKEFITDIEKIECNNVLIPTKRNVLKTIPLGIFAISVLLPASSEAAPQQKTSFSFTNNSRGIGRIIRHEEKDTVNFGKMKYCMQIQDLGTLKDNWDGYDAIRVLPICISNAQNIINYEYIRCEHIQDIYANPNGTLSILWENDDNESIGLEVGENVMSYYVVRKSGHDFMKNESFTKESFSVLSSYISQL